MSAVTLAPIGRAGMIRNTLTIARRNLLHIKATPEQLVEMSIQPLMFLVLFVYVFGGAIASTCSLRSRGSSCRAWRSCRSPPRSP
jgi:hypothetical protein